MSVVVFLLGSCLEILKMYSTIFKDISEDSSDPLPLLWEFYILTQVQELQIF